MRWALVAVVVIATNAVAHWLSPEEVMAALVAPVARVALGVEGAETDVQNPRVLLVRVGARWFDLDRGVRATTAQEWYATWRDAVPQGVVAVLDVHTGEPVVRYGRDGIVVGMRDTR